MGESSLLDLGSWRDVIAEKFNVRSISSRQFSSLTGLSEASANYIYDKYCSNEFIFKTPLLCPRDEASFLMFTNWIKDYSCEDNLALFWHVGKSLFRDSNKSALLYFSANLDEVRLTQFPPVFTNI